MRRRNISNIYKRLLNVYGKYVLNVKGADNPKEKGENELSDRLHNGRPAAAENKDKTKMFSAFIAADRRVILSEFFSFQRSVQIAFTE